MTQKVIRIPTLNDSPHDFAWLFGIWNEVNNYFGDIRFDFSHCGFLRPNAVAFLGGLARLIESRRGTAVFDWNTLQAKVMTIIHQNGFASVFGDTSAPRDGTSIPYREDREFHPDEVADSTVGELARQGNGLSYQA